MIFRKYLFFLLYLFLCLGSARAQNETRRITDHHLQGMIVKALEEYGQLNGSYREHAFDGAVMLFDHQSGEEPVIKNFRVLTRHGESILPDIASGTEIRSLLGDGLYHHLLSEKYLFEVTDADYVRTQLSRDESRNAFWWSSADIELSLERVILKFSSNMGVMIQQGDSYLGLPQDLSGWTRIGLCTEDAMIGFQAPVSLRVSVPNERKLDGGLGVYAGVHIHDGAFAVKGSGYYQMTDDPAIVNVLNPALTYRSPWGSMITGEYFLGVGKTKTIQICAGMGMMSIMRGQVSGSTIISFPENPTQSLSSTYTLHKGFSVLLRYSSERIAGATPTSYYRTLESEIGYSFNGVCATIAFFLSPSIGLKVGGIFYPSPNDWQPKYVCFITPVIRLNY